MNLTKEAGEGHRDDSRTTGFEEYRAHVGIPEYYDYASALQFNLLTTLGLREHHDLLDIGCGSLRAGRLFIPYLRAGHYHGIEPLDWLVREGIEKELGESAIALKQPVFSHDTDFTLTTFGKSFDFLIAQSIFSHATQSQITRCMSQARSVMKPESIFAATFFEGTTNYKGDHWAVYAEYTMDHFRALVEAQDLICRPVEWAHQDLQRWVLILHPDSRYHVPRAADLNYVSKLEDRLVRTERQLQALRGKAVVRLGRQLKFFLFGVRAKGRELKRAWPGSRP